MFGIFSKKGTHRRGKPETLGTQPAGGSGQSSGEIIHVDELAEIRKELVRQNAMLDTIARRLDRLNDSVVDFIEEMRGESEDLGTVTSTGIGKDSEL